MDQLIVILFACIALPLIMLFFIAKGDSKVLILFLILGFFVAVFAAFVNSYVLELSGADPVQITYIFTPVVEELLKALPVLFYALVFRPKKKLLLDSAMMVGVGFAILENTFLLVNDAAHATFAWAAIRGLGAGLMHALSTYFVAYGISFIMTKKKKLPIATYGLLILAINYHADYNVMAQSDYRYLTIIFPVLTFAAIMIGQAKGKKKKKKVALEVTNAKNEVDS